MTFLRSWPAGAYRVFHPPERAADKNPFLSRQEVDNAARLYTFFLIALLTSATEWHRLVLKRLIKISRMARRTYIDTDPIDSSYLWICSFHPF